MKKPCYSVVSSKGQTVIPSDLRKELQINQGSLLHFQAISENTFVVRVMDESTTAQVPPQTHTVRKVPSVGLKKVF